MVKTQNNNKLPNNLPQLQNLIKRDPESYKDEFNQQYRHYLATLQIFQLKPSLHNETLGELVTFISQVSNCYQDELSEFPQQLKDLLQRHATVMDTDNRMTLCKALMLLRNKGLISATAVLEMFFELFRCQDKILRKTLYNYIVQDIKNTNAKHKNTAMNMTLQNFMYTMLRDNNSVAAKMSLDVMVELYKRKVWHDEKTVNVITTACFSKITKILVGALKFFLGSDNEEEEEESESEDDEPDKKTAKDLLLSHRVGKKTKKREKRLKRALQVVKKTKKNRKAVTFNFSAIHLIHDPQGFAERLFKQLESSNERFEVKLMMMNLVSRLIGIHELFVFNFYPFIQRFLQPHQREVTKVLQYTAQASHELIPPDVLEPLIQTIINNFVTERNSGEGIAVGLNTVREVCSRCPLVMNKDTMEYISDLKTHKDKNVMMACRSVIRLFREKNPGLLAKKDRGKPTEAMLEAKQPEYGELVTKDYLPGAELFMATSHTDKPATEQENEWESCSEEEMEDDSDGSWIDVHHSSDEEQEKKEEETMTAEEKEKRAREVTQTQILTQDQFKQLRMRQMAKQVSEGAKGKGRKRRAEESLQAMEQSTGSGDVVNLSSIERLYKRRAQTKTERMESVMAGREGRDKFGAWSKRRNPMASTTNREKKKKKAFSMIKQKAKGKQKRSYHDKQMTLKRAMLKRMKDYKRR